MTATTFDSLDARPVTRAAPARLERLWRGRPDDPAWARPALLGLLLATGLLYTWGLGASGWANSFYSAAVQAGATSWKAFFFGASDAAGFITVDKPPAALWVMELSARVFGVSSWSVLVPQALEGVAAVALLHATVRRHHSAAAGLLAGAAMATTPVAALMFRFNNPDALLVLLLVVAVYCTTRALETASTRWLALAGSALGFGFLTKMLQALVIVPALAVVYLALAPTGVGRRVRQLLVAGAALVASAGWWIAAVALTPASMRPYVGGSQHNSIIELTLGYNGLGRLTGNETGSVGGGNGPSGPSWGETGWLRMFNDSYGSQASWLIPGALVLLATCLWVGRRAARTDGHRAALLLWGGWLVVTGLVFSLAKGIIHEYYTVALAPAIGALAGIGAVTLWSLREQLAARLGLAAAVAVTALWTARLLDRTPTWHAGLRPLVVLVGLGSAVVLVGAEVLPRVGAQVLAVVALVGVLAAPAVAAVETARQPHTGALVTAAPSTGRSGPGGAGRPGRGLPPGVIGGTTQGLPPGFAGSPGQVGPGPVGQGGPGQGGLGGLLDASTPSADLVALVRAGAAGYTWAAAAVGSNSAAGVQLATGKPVMSLGGFNGSDPAPSLAAFQQLVAAGKVHYFLSGGGGPGGFGPQNGGSSVTAEITAWVQQSFTATTVGGVTVYDLSSGAVAASSA